MKTISDLAPMRDYIASLRSNKKSIALVMTMGFLHEGHISLMRLARKHADVVIATIFVNPTQFNQREDLEKYPRDLPRDSALLEAAGVDALYTPSEEELYGQGYQSWISVDDLTKPLEGPCRPGHFRGVTTIVGMVFNIIQPDFAVFGEKDFQQLSIIERMVRDLKFPITVIRGPLVREADGLALSSRNVRLSPAGRSKALHLSRGLRAAQQAWVGGELRGSRLREIVLAELGREPSINPEYVAVVDEATLLDVEDTKAKARILLAAWVDGVRLIDTVALTHASI